jgi:DNA polymerase-3 subunit delta'
MGFEDFLGNPRILEALRGMLRRKRTPSALLFSGPRGIGKFTLARMFAQAASCEKSLDDFCGTCESCQKIGRLSEPALLIEQGLTERGESADAAMVDRTPLIVETHPDVWLIPPDPVRLHTPVARPMIRIGQLRAVQRAAYFRPQAKRRIFIVDGADTMRWNDADVFLKTLEEPPETATFILLAPSPEDLLPTIRSRCLQFHFAPVPEDKIESFLETRVKLSPKDRKITAQLAGGSPGVALTLDVKESLRLRGAALRMIHQAIHSKDYGAIFAATEKFAKKEKEPFENILHLIYTLFTDLLEVSLCPKSSLPRNPDLRREIEALGNRINWEWVDRATRGLDLLEGRLPRNIGKQLGLDAYVSSLGSS